MRRRVATFLGAGLLALASGGCEFGGGGGAPPAGLALLGLIPATNPPTGTTPQPNTYSVGGSVSGLADGQSVTVQLNGHETKVVDSNTSFSFDNQLAEGASYAVHVTAATGTTCMAGLNTGTIASSSVTTVAVHCSATTYVLRVNVTGLQAGNTVTFQNNGSMDLVVNADGPTNFAVQVPSGSLFNVTVSAQPSTLTQICTPSANTGQVAANPTTIAVGCSPDYYTVSGNYSGLAGGGLQIRLTNTGETITRNLNPHGAAGAFSFTVPVADNSSYSVTVIQNPSNLNQTCSVGNGSGTMSGANVTNVTVTCTTNQYTVGGTVSGMGTGDSVTIRVNGGSDQVVNHPGTSFSWNLTDGTGYAVSIGAHAPGKTCSVTGGSGTLAGSNVNVSINCVFNTYTVGGSVSGLCATQSITLQNNSGNDLVVNGSSGFTFPAQNDLSAYSVSVKSGTSPTGVNCVVSNGSNTLSGASVTNVSLACTGCNSCAGSDQLTVSWTKSRSYDVSTATGGGHRIYLATSSGVTTSAPLFWNVPNTTSTTSGVVTGRTSGCTYYLKVQPYSAINPAGSAGANLSAEKSISIP